MIKKIDANKYGVVRYAISSIEDIADLPREVSVGSEAILVNEDGEKKFRLGSDGWVEVVEVKEYDEDKLRDILEDAKVGYGGIEYETLEERLDKDFDNAYSVLDNRTYVGYEGCRITAKDSLNGLQKETVVKGRTLQNLMPTDVNYTGYNITRLGDSSPNHIKGTINHVNFIIWAGRDSLIPKMKSSTVYTVIGELKSNKTIIECNIAITDNVGIKYYTNVALISLNSTSGRFVTKITTDQDLSLDPSKFVVLALRFSIKDLILGEDWIQCDNLILLEGDYTQTPIEELPFIEGIESVGDKSKNLFDGKTRNGYYSSGEFKVNSSNLANVNPIEIKPNTYYTGSGDALPRMSFYDSDMNFISYNPNLTTCLSPSNAKYMNIHAFGATYFQIEEGSQVTSYEPYYDGYKISGKSIGKNLFNSKIHYDIYRMSTTIYKKDVGTYKLPNSISGSHKLIRVELPIGKTYEITINHFDKYYNAWTFGIFENDEGSFALDREVYVSAYAISYTNTPLTTTFTTKHRYQFIKVEYNSNPNADQDVLDSIQIIQIEEGEEIISYEPYKESTYSYIIDEPLRSLPNGVCDEIDLEKGVVTRRVGKYTFTGDEPTFGEATEVTGDVTTTYLTIQDRAKGQENNIICNSLACYPYGVYEDIQGILVSSYSCFVFSFKNGTLKSNDIEGVKQWFKDNPTTVYYELATPITEYLIKDDKFVTLPNGVKDEAGRIVTRKVGKIVLDGSNDEKWEVWNTAGENVYKFVVSIPNLKAMSGNPLLCNIFKYLSLANADEEGIYNGNQGRMGLKISKTKLTSESIEELRKWLVLNPLTVYYQLETPYIECSYEKYPALPNGVTDEIAYNSVLRRVGKFVVDGSQVLTRSNTNSNKTKTTHFSVNGVSSNSPYGICDKLPTVIDVALQVYEEPCMKFSSADKINPPYALWLNIDRSNADTVEEAYEYFRNNPHTVWYELIKPYVEPINLDEVILDTTRLKSYEPITHITSDNYLPPTIKTQVPSDFNAVVLGLKNNNEALASQVMSLRQTNDELEATNREQDDVIDVTLLALDEVYGMIDESEIETMSVGSPMVNVYVKMIKRGIKTLDEVPAKYRAEVEELI